MIARRNAAALAAALVIGGAAGATAHHGAVDRLNPARVTLDRVTFEDGSSRAKVRLVVPARVHGLRVKRRLARRGRVVSFVVVWCHNGHACDNRGGNRR